MTYLIFLLIFFTQRLTTLIYFVKPQKGSFNFISSTFKIYFVLGGLNTVGIKLTFDAQYSSIHKMTKIIIFASIKCPKNIKLSSFYLFW